MFDPGIKHVYIYTYKYSCVHTWVHIYIYIYIYIHTHTHTHITSVCGVQKMGITCLEWESNPHFFHSWLKVLTIRLSRFPDEVNLDSPRYDTEGNFYHVNLGLLLCAFVLH